MQLTYFNFYKIVHASYKISMPNSKYYMQLKIFRRDNLSASRIFYCAFWKGSYATVGSH